MIQDMTQRPKNPTKKEIITTRPSVSYGFVTGPPSKELWKPDDRAPECSLCGQKFSLLLRRHHCRRCGDVFCHLCSQVILSHVESTSTGSGLPLSSRRTTCTSLWYLFFRINPTAEPLRINTGFTDNSTTKYARLMHWPRSRWNINVGTNRLDLVYLLN